MFSIVLCQPQIPANSGNIIRLCANTGCALHMVEPLGFELSDRHLQRAGLDYHEYVNIKTYRNWQHFLDVCAPKRWFALTTKGSVSVFATQFNVGDYFVFGSETQGLGQTFLERCAPHQKLRLPMLATQRSLNLSNSVAVCVFEAWRQCGFASA